jgi:hypothetical protein
MKTPLPLTVLSRRVFLKAAASQAAAVAAGRLPVATVLRAAEPAPKSIGIKIGAVSFADEGKEKVLDLLQERGAVDTIYLTTFTYGRGLAGRQISGRPWIDGILFFNERNGPLLNALGASHAQRIASSRVTCFCEHHQRAAQERGVDHQRARQGYQKLMPAKGHIGLQVHGGGDMTKLFVRYRNIRVKRLN